MIVNKINRISVNSIIFKNTIETAITQTDHD
jgi:hypothetical protein